MILKTSMQQPNTALRRAFFLLAAALLALCFILGSVSCSVIEETEKEQQKEEETAAKAKEIYDRAVEAYREWDFAEAKRLFAESGMYGNSDEYFAAMEEYEKRYLDGVKAMENRDYATALSNFQSMPEYLNSRDYIDRISALEAEYRHGVELYDEKDYFEARNCFLAAEGYSNSDDFVESIDKMVELYNNAIALMNRSEYSEAISAFMAIGTEFGDSEAMIAECQRRLREGGVTLSGYIANYNAIDENARITAGSPGKDFTLRDTNGVIFAGTTNDKGSILKIQFGFREAVRVQLGEAGFREALCRCILALNPYISDIETVRSGLASYLSGSGAGYGCMWIHASSGSDGSIVVEAVRVSFGA